MGNLAISLFIPVLFRPRGKVNIHTVADSGGGRGRPPPLVAQWLKKRAKVPFKSVENERKCLIGCPFHVQNMIRCPLGCSFIQ